MSYLDTTFSYYPAKIETTVPLGEISLYDYLYKIKNPRPEIVEIFKKIEKASLDGDKKRKAELKQTLWYFTPCIKTDGLGRSYDNIVEWNEILIVDLDNLDKDFAVEMRDYLFNTYPFIIASFLSASKKGCKLLVRIPKCTSVEQFKSYFYGLMAEFQFYQGIDFSSKNCCLPNFLTHDEGLKYRIDATVWDGIGIQIDEFKEFDGVIEPLETVEQEDIDGIKLFLKRMIAKVDVEQSGHNLVRSTSLLGGAYCGMGYMSYEEVRDYIFELIENSEYLQKGLRGYKKTAEQMITIGITSPLKYSRNER